MRQLIIVSVVALATLIVLNSIMADETSSTTVPATYFGVDASDQEAVRQRQKELSHEKWTDLYGHEVSADDMDFGPDFGGPKIMSHTVDAVRKFNNALKTLLGLLTPRPMTTTTFDPTKFLESITTSAPSAEQTSEPQA